MFFVKVKRQGTTFNRMQFGEVMKQLAKEWAALTEEQRKPYVEMSESDNVRYEKELREIIDSKITRTKEQPVIPTN